MHTTIQFLCNPAYLTLLFIGGSVLLIVGMLPFLMNLIKPNLIGGVRCRATLSDERVWYLANSYCAKSNIVVGIITIIVALVLRLTDMAPIMYQWVCTISLVGGLLLASLLTFLYIKQIS